MAEVDNSTLQEVDLDKAFGETGDAVKEQVPANSEKTQTAELNVENFLQDMNAELENKEPEKEVKTEKEVETKSQAETETPQEEADRLKAEIETLKKRYADSSKEGKKVAELEKRLAEVEPKVKVYDQIVADQNLENMIVDYWQKGSRQPSNNLKDKLGLSEDFMFDPEDIAKPGTDSYKLFQASVVESASQIVDERFKQLQIENAKKERIARIEAMKNEFIGKYGESELSKLEEFMNDKQLTLEDFRKLMNYNERDREIAKNAATQQSEQIKKNQGVEKSLATAKSTPVHKTDERSMIDFLKTVGGGDFSFGN